jgi:hypothetical protein
LRKRALSIHDALCHPLPSRNALTQVEPRKSKVFVVWWILVKTLSVWNSFQHLPKPRSHSHYLAGNAGLNPIVIVTELRNRHAKETFIQNNQRHHLHILKKNVVALYLSVPLYRATSQRLSRRWLWKIDDIVKLSGVCIATLISRMQSHTIFVYALMMMMMITLWSFIMY